MNYFINFLLLFFVIESVSQGPDLNQLNKSLEACNLLKNPNAKNKCKQRILKLIEKLLKKHANQKKEEQNKQNIPDEKNKSDKEETVEILTLFASIVTSIGKLIVSPCDPLNLTTSLCAMITAAINLSNKITRSNCITENDVELLIKQLSTEQKNQLKIIYAAALGIQLS